MITFPSATATPASKRVSSALISIGTSPKLPNCARAPTAVRSSTSRRSRGRRFIERRRTLTKGTKGGKGNLRCKFVIWSVTQDGLPLVLARVKRIIPGGLLAVIEGIDGAGKSTLLPVLAEHV